MQNPTNKPFSLSQMALLLLLECLADLRRYSSDDADDRAGRALMVIEAFVMAHNRIAAEVLGEICTKIEAFPQWTALEAVIFADRYTDGMQAPIVSPFALKRNATWVQAQILASVRMATRKARDDWHLTRLIYEAEPKGPIEDKAKGEILALLNDRQKAATGDQIVEVLDWLGAPSLKMSWPAVEALQFAVRCTNGREDARDVIKTMIPAVYSPDVLNELDQAIPERWLTGSLEFTRKHLIEVIQYHAPGWVPPKAEPGPDCKVDLAAFDLIARLGQIEIRFDDEDQRWVAKSKLLIGDVVAPTFPQLAAKVIEVCREKIRADRAQLLADAEALARVLSETGG